MFRSRGLPFPSLFVATDQRSAVTQWAHASVPSCHPGVKRILAKVQQRFWWPSNADDVLGTRAPTRPLLDYWTFCLLPDAHGLMSHWTVVDCFSKMIHLSVGNLGCLNASTRSRKKGFVTCGLDSNSLESETNLGQICSYYSAFCVHRFSPFECVYGYQTPLFPALETEVSSRQKMSPYLG